MDFLESLKVAPDLEKDMLLKIQNRLKEDGATPENVLKLTKNLTENQKESLKHLYKEQISDLELSIENHRRRIVEIRRELNGEKK